MQKYLIAVMGCILLHGLCGCYPDGAPDQRPENSMSEAEKMEICNAMIDDKETCYVLKNDVCFGMNHREGFIECVKKNTSTPGKVRLDPGGAAEMEQIIRTKSRRD